MTTYDPENAGSKIAPAPKRIIEELGGTMALDCAVLGERLDSTKGDPVEVLKGFGALLCENPESAFHDRKELRPKNEI